MATAGASVSTEEEEEDPQALFAELRQAAADFEKAFTSKVGIDAALEALNAAQAKVEAWVGTSIGSATGGVDVVGGAVVPTAPQGSVGPATQPGTMLAPPVAGERPQVSSASEVQPGQINLGGFQPGAPAYPERSNISAVDRYGGGGANMALPLANRRRLLAEQLPGSAPVSAQLGEAHGAEELIARSQGDLRKSIGMSEDYYQPQPQGGLERFGRGLLQGTVFDSVVRPPSAAEFKEVTAEQLMEDPLIAERFSLLSEEEKAMVLAADSGKAVEILSLGEAEYKRLMGSKTQTTVGSQRIQVETGGLAGGGAGGSGGYVGAPGPGTGGGRLGAGEISSRNVGDYEDPFPVTLMEDYQGSEAMTQFMMTSRELREQVNNGVPLAETVDKPHELNTYYSRLTKTAGTFTNLEMMDPELRSEWIKDTGTQVDVKRLSDGEEMTIPYVEMVLHQDRYGAQSELVSVIERESGDLVKVDKAEVARNPKKYRDETQRGLYHVINQHKVEDWLTEEELHNAEAGVWSKPITKQHIVTSELAENAARIPLMMAQSADALDIIGRGGARIFGLAGDAADLLYRWFDYFGNPEGGQKIYNAITGGTEVSANEVKTMRRYLVGLATGRRDFVLHDKGRLSDKDLEILISMLHLNELFTSAEQVGFSIQTFAGFEIVYDELLRANGWGGPSQFPVGTGQEYSDTIDRLLEHNFSEERAGWIAGWLVKSHEWTSIEQRQKLFPDNFPKNAPPTNVQREPDER
jgi:hypothetical protein